jgi:hypothetical protein
MLTVEPAEDLTLPAWIALNTAMHVLFGNVEIDPTISFEVSKQGVSLLQAYKDSVAVLALDQFWIYEENEESTQEQPSEAFGSRENQREGMEASKCTQEKKWKLV